MSFRRIIARRRGDEREVVLVVNILNDVPACMQTKWLNLTFESVTTAPNKLGSPLYLVSPVTASFSHHFLGNISLYSCRVGWRRVCTPPRLKVFTFTGGIMFRSRLPKLAEFA